MTCCENTKLNKVISLFVSICFLFCVLVSPATVPKAHAEVITLTSAAVVIASILVATGVYVVGGMITDKVKTLIDNIRLDIAMNDIQVTSEGGVGYVQKSVVDAVVNSANKFQVYDPTSTKYNSSTFTCGNLGTGLVMGLSDFQHLSYAEQNSFLSSTGSFLKYDGGSSFLGRPVVYDKINFGSLGIEFLDDNSYTDFYPAATPCFSSPMSKGDIISNNPYYLTWSYNSVQYITASFAMFLVSFGDYVCGNSVRTPSGRELKVVVNSKDFARAGICAEGSLPKFNSLGVVEGYPLDWAVPRTVAGNPSVPLSVPKTLDGVKDLTQEKAQSGVVENTDSKPDVKPEDANKDFERNKTKFMLPAIVKERFPFCIPFDIYNGILLLSAPAVAPVLTIPLKFDYQDTHFGQDLVFDFNNKDFQLPFAVLRWGEMLCFVIALAAATKKIVWG